MNLSTTTHIRATSTLQPNYVGTWLIQQYAGSIVHGTYVPTGDPHHIDDVDIIGAWLPTERGLYGLENPEHWVKAPGDSAEELHGELDITSYEVRKFARLLLKGNPNVLGMLWTPRQHWLYSIPAWTAWIAHRDAFLSMRCLASFSGYAYAQLMKLGKPNTRGYMGAERKRLFATYGFDPKNAAHCIRLLRMGIELMENGTLFVDRTLVDADELKEIKQGKWSLNQIQRVAQDGFAVLNKYKDAPPFPDKPDYSRVEALVIQTIKGKFS